MWTAAVYSGSLAGVEQSATTSAPERRRNSSSVIAGAAVVNPRIAHEQPPCERRAPGHECTSNTDPVVSNGFAIVIRLGRPGRHSPLVVLRAAGARQFHGTNVPLLTAVTGRSFRGVTVPRPLVRDASRSGWRGPTRGSSSVSPGACNGLAAPR